ncbi:MAG: TolC family protein [Sedimentisphaerales bacterium]|jgi:outer membrane protein TolC
MKPTNNLILCLLLSAILLPGCVSKEEFYDDVTLSRQSAYKQWEDRKQTEKQTQAVISGSMSLDDCLKLTLTNNKSLLKTLEEKEVARGAELGSYSAALPSVGLSAGYERLDKISTLSGALDNYSAGLTVTQPIFAGAAIPAKINAGRLGVLLADQTVRAAVQETIYAAEHAYYTVLLDQHLYTISDDAVKSAKAHLDDVKQRREAGVASNFDVLRAEVELSNFTAQLIQSQNAIHVAKAGLVKIMGVSQDSTFALSDELLYSPSDITMQQAVASAYRSRPDLFGKEIGIRQQKELLAIVRSEYFPVVSAYYDNVLTKPDPHNTALVEWGSAWNAGLLATWPIFDGFAREGSIIEQKARLKQSQIDLVDTEETALFELTSAILSIEDAAEFVDSQKFNLSRAAEGLRLAEVGYREGINTQVEVIDAQAALTTAKANYYQAIYSHLVAKLDLQKAMGALTSFEPVRSTQSAPDSNNVQMEQTKK